MAMLVNDIRDLINVVKAATGYLPVRIDVDEDFHADIDPMTTGMRTISVFSVPIFIDNTLTVTYYNYYIPTAPYTAVKTAH